MCAEGVHVIATTISGSIQDWGKVARIEPLFAEQGLTDVRVHRTDSHPEARRRTEDLVRGGARTLISAGGSGTFNAVLEGCCDSGTPLAELRLGFLRKGSADLIGKVLGMPDDVESAVQVFAEAIRLDRTVPCDVLAAVPSAGPLRHFVGYGGAELFGRIPHFTESRFIKWYKGVLGQVFGDLGPFTTGMTLAAGERILRRPFSRIRRWFVREDDRVLAQGRFHAFILTNGYLGPDLPFAADPLGSGHFHLFGLEDLGLGRFLGQMRRALDTTILEDPERWGLWEFTVCGALELEPDDSRPFPVNVDGSTLLCRGVASFRIVDRVRLLTRREDISRPRREPAPG